MLDRTWLIYWTGSGALAGIRTYGLLFSMPDGHLYDVRLSRAWWLEPCGGREIDTSLISDEIVAQARTACSYRLSRFGIRTGTRIHAVRPLAVDYDPAEVRRHGLTDPVRLCNWLTSQPHQKIAT